MTVPALHADDAMGLAAHKAAQFASRLDFRLLAAASASVNRDERAASLRQALEQWPKLCRAMAVLEQAAPNIARLAREADATMQDFIEERALTIAHGQSSPGGNAENIGEIERQRGTA
jgi:hypothetical protein